MEVLILIFLGVLVSGLLITYVVLPRLWGRTNSRSGVPRETVSYRTTARLERIEADVRQIQKWQRWTDERLNRLGNELSRLRTAPLEQRDGNQPETAVLVPTGASELAEYRFPTGGAFDSLCTAYNNSTSNRNYRTDFFRTYNPTTVGVENAVSRRRDPTISPNFQTASDGDYLVARLEVRTGSASAVVPRFDLTIEESSYGPGALGTVFECKGYDSHLRYPYPKLIRPALFEDSGGSTWRLVQQGVLDLGPGE